MKYAIYGVNRVAKDFIYFFDKIEITCFFDDIWDKDYFENRCVYSVEEINSIEGFDKIIICDFDKSAKETTLLERGMKYGIDYIYEEDFFDQLDPDKAHGGSIIIWGTGKRAEKFMLEEQGLNPQFFVDKKPRDNFFYGIKVVLPDQIEDWRNSFVIIAVEDDRDIREFLSEKGLHAGTDFCSSLDFIERPSLLLRKTIFDPSSYDLACETMLNHLEVINEKGDTICCCSTFNHTMLGSMEEMALNDIWNAAKHKILCLSNVNHTYSFCDKRMCPLFIGKKEENPIDIEREYAHMDNYPKTVAIAFDESCNLRCITCRKKTKVADENEQKRYRNYARKIKSEILPHCEFLIAAGNGEVFLSKAYQEIYCSDEMESVQYLRFLTNGMLFTSKKWKELREHYHGKVMMTVSIDAATKDTYEMIRVGGNFDILNRNMEYAAFLRKTGDLSYLRFNFVVQRENYKEMPLFVQWGKRLGIDEVFFTKILNWGTYSDEEFRYISMMEEDGVTPKKELLDILDDPVMRSDIVDLGTIHSHRRGVSDRAITNYYRWELERKVSDLFG